jgi:capsular polysaccharide export protein
LISAATSILLKDKSNFGDGANPRQVGRAVVAAAPWVPLAKPMPHASVLRIPPFPGARVQSFIERQGAGADPHEVAAALVKWKVGGTYWGAQPHVPKGCLLVRSSVANNAAADLLPEKPVVIWDQSAGDCDPWHMLSGASALVAESDDEVRLIAAVLGVPCYHFDPEAGLIGPVRIDKQLVAETLARTSFENPFTGEAMDALAAVELCGFWRRLIDANRCLGGGVGFAFWKQSHVAPLLWNGSTAFRFLPRIEGGNALDCLAVWRAKVPAAEIAELERRQVKLVEVEDGFLRSRGLGADCIPPLSITVDHLGAHFDPSQPSELERLLQGGSFDEELLDRARELRQLIVEAGIGKYERGTAVLERRAGGRRHILVPGQVEDDRAVLAGGCGLVSNLELLRRVREQAPDAYVLYKPHPDVVAGHRRGIIRDRDSLEFADEIVGELPIASLIAMVDEVHVNTSLAGFEALLRGKQVTTYGVPFYAGWGLTRDLGPVPERRTAKRTIDELVAATLLIYPRYLDPATGLPCPAEVVVGRLSVSEDRSEGLIVGMRRLQGKFMRRLRSLVQ